MTRVAADYSTRIQARLKAASLTVSPDVLAALASYVALLARWNRRINLTAFPLDDPSDAAIDRLIVEPVAGAAAVHPDDRVAVDIGSGGGSPALPLKITAPHLAMVLVESREKKSAFLREAARALALPDVRVATMRMGPEGLTGVNGTADLVTLRAVRADSGIWRAVDQLLSPGGRIFWFRELGGDGADLPDGWTFEERPLVARHALVVGRRGVTA